MYMTQLENELFAKKPGLFRAVFPVSVSEADQFIVDLRARLTRHGVVIDIPKWEWNYRHRPGLSVFLPREHYPLIKSLLTLMFQSGELESCFLVPQVTMQSICGYRMIESYDAQGRQKVLLDALTGLTYRTSFNSLIEAEERYAKNGNVVCELVRAGLGME